ncbi:TonB-dependent receptor domain-containing protein [Brucellaceae bacterium C25G]
MRTVMIKIARKTNMQKTFRVTLLASALYCSAAPFTMVGVLAQVTTPYSFSIPAQPLAQALVHFSATTGVDIVFDGVLPAGARSQALMGNYSATNGLRQILTGTNLTYRFSSATTAIIVNPSQQTTINGANSGGDTILLDTITVTGENNLSAADAPYETPGSSAYLTGEQVERYQGTSVGDFLGGIPGVMNSDGRNSGGIDMNIRGMQGQGRVPVIVDGASQENTVYQGYNGSTSRSYIDPDFIGNVSVEKGISMGADATGATGGVVRINTIGVDDVLLPGKSFGVRLKGGFNTNSSSVPAPGTQVGFTAGLGDKYFSDEGSDRPPFLLPTGASGSIVAAGTTEYVDVVAGYARRKNGNYHAGSHGSGMAYPTEEIDDFYNTPIMVNGGISNYRGGEEVVNTSQDIQSWLFKGKLKLDNGHSLEIGYSKYKSDYGHFLGSQVFFGPGFYQGLLSSIELDTYTGRYRWKPDDNDLIDLKVDTFFSRVDNRINSTLYGKPNLSPTFFWIGSDRWGVTASNTSRFQTEVGALNFEYGGAFTREDVGMPQGTTYDSSTMYYPRDGLRKEASAFSSVEWKPNDWLTLHGSLRYSHFNSVDNSPTLEQPYKRSDGGWSPVATITIEPLDGFQIYGKAGSVLRSPSIFETLTGMSFGIPVELNPVEPERAQNIEFGINYLQDNVFLAGDTIRFHAAYFDNKIKNYITRSNVKRELDWGTFYVLGRLNLDYAKMRGVEMSADYDTGKYFGGISWNHYTDVMFCAPGGGAIDPLWDKCSAGGVFNSFSVQQVPPKDTFTLNLGARFFEDKLTVGSRFSYVGKRFVEGSGAGGNTANAVVPGYIIPSKWKPYFIVDVFGSYKLSESARLDVAIDNLTDRYYVDAINTMPIAAPGRTVRGAFTVKF